MSHFCAVEIRVFSLRLNGNILRFQVFITLLRLIPHGNIGIPLEFIDQFFVSNPNFMTPKIQIHSILDWIPLNPDASGHIHGIE